VPCTIGTGIHTKASGAMINFGAKEFSISRVAITMKVTLSTATLKALGSCFLSA
jgi:hypothetical protein